MNFLSLFGGMGGGGGAAPLEARSSADANSAGSGGGSVGITSKDLVWIAVAFAGALALFGIVWIALKKN